MHCLVLPSLRSSHNCLVRVEGTEKLHVDAADAVIGVIIGNIRSQWPGADISDLYSVSAIMQGV